MTDGDDDPCCKVGRAAREYRLETLDQEMVRRYDADASLRDLESTVNARILEGAIRAAGADLFSSADSLYEQLTGETATAGEVADLRTKLEQEGVAIDDVEASFVSYQTIRHHLNECLEVDTSREASTTPSDALDTIDWARTRSEAVIERTIEQLGKSGQLDVNGVDVSQSVVVTCASCGRTHNVGELLDSGGCQCMAGSE